MHKVLVSNTNFGQANPLALQRLQEIADVTLNPHNRHLSEDELATDAKIIIAGTEKISKKVIQSSPNLTHIIRIGVGTDNIDLTTAEQHDIKIVTTHNGLENAVTELTLANMIALLRGTAITHNSIINNRWTRVTGRQLSSATIGIIGMGRIGTALKALINRAFPSCTILAFDPSVPHCSNFNSILELADIISIHVPLNDSTKDMFNSETIYKMKPGSCLINTSRGGIINEEALYHALKTKHLSGAALDVFEQEPYSGPLTKLENCILTSHIAGMTLEARSQMEADAINTVHTILSCAATLTSNIKSHSSTLMALS